LTYIIHQIPTAIKGGFFPHDRDRKLLFVFTLRLFRNVLIFDLLLWHFEIYIFILIYFIVELNLPVRVRLVEDLRL
jgi:hypothetical protein